MLTNVAARKKVSAAARKRIGSLGGRRRAEVLSKERRREIAASGAKAYWAKYRELRELKAPVAKKKPPRGSDQRQGSLL